MVSAVSVCEGAYTQDPPDHASAVRLKCDRRPTATLDLRVGLLGDFDFTSSGPERSEYRRRRCVADGSMSKPQPVNTTPPSWYETVTELNDHGRNHYHCRAWT